jgi:anti-sigma factor RsiW
MDYLGERGVMALVYRRRAHVINLFVWPDTAAADTLPRTLSRQGYNLVQFRREGMAFWAVSDLNPEELTAFAALL